MIEAAEDDFDLCPVGDIALVEVERLGQREARGLRMEDAPQALDQVAAASTGRPDQQHVGLRE